ncbi:MAG: ABC transporter permease [Desulfosarcina sp.]|nr:ABC transporter permease [Desulfosarcina sp.]
MPVGITHQQRIWLTFKRNKTAVAGLVIGVFIVLTALLAPWIAPMDPLAQDPFNRLTWDVEGYLLGTDDFGRDVLSRIIWGSRVSLMIGGASVLLGLVIGTMLGMIAGFFRGKTEVMIMRSVDVMMSFPDLILAIAITAALGASTTNLVITIGIVMTPRFARMAYGSVISIMESDYVLAARAIGARAPRTLFRHILPNIFGELVVAGTLWVGEAIRLEANLAFIGLGVQPPTPTWGNMTREGIDVLINAPWISIFAGLSILITILSLNMLGDGIRDISDPKLRGGEGKGYI